MLTGSGAEAWRTLGETGQWAKRKQLGRTRPRGGGESCQQLGPPNSRGLPERLSWAPLEAKASLCGRKDNLSYHPPHAFIVTVPHDWGPCSPHLSPSSGGGLVLEEQSYDIPPLLKPSVDSPTFSENITPGQPPLMCGLWLSICRLSVGKPWAPPTHTEPQSIFRSCY